VAQLEQRSLEQELGPERSGDCESQISTAGFIALSVNNFHTGMPPASQCLHDLTRTRSPAEHVDALAECGVPNNPFVFV